MSAKHNNHKRGQTVPPPQEEAHSLNMQALRAAQGTNANVLSRIKTVLEKTNQQGSGCYIRWEPRHVETKWLGVGYLSAADGFTSTSNDNNDEPIKNNANLFPTFCSLKRPATLLSKCRIVTENSDDQAWIETIWNGRNLVFFIKNPSHQDGLPAENGSDSSVELIVITTEDIPLLYYTWSPPQESSVLQTHQQMHRFVTDEERKLLISRIMHFFLREFAYLLPAHVLVDLMDKLLEPNCPLTSKKYKEDYLDWQILRADLLLSLPNMTSDSHADDLALEIYQRLSSVGRALAALGRFAESSRLYMEIGDTFHKSVFPFLHAHFGFHALGDFDTSLDCGAKYLARLTTVDPNPDLDKQEYLNVLLGILVCFHCKFEQSLSQADTGNRQLVLPQDASDALGCLALFSTAQEKLRFMVSGFGIHNSVNLSSYLKSQVGRPARAKRALVKLMRSGSIQEYKTAFCKFVDPTKPIPFQPNFDTSSSETFRQMVAEKNRKSAMFFCKYGYSSHCNACGNIGKALFCPCQKVKYCCKECQLSHWKYHKESCSVHLSKKEKQNAN